MVFFCGELNCSVVLWSHKSVQSTRNVKDNGGMLSQDLVGCVVCYALAQLSITRMVIATSTRLWLNFFFSLILLHFCPLFMLFAQMGSLFDQMGLFLHRIPPLTPVPTYPFKHNHTTKIPHFNPPPPPTAPEKPAPAHLVLNQRWQLRSK